MQFAIRLAADPRSPFEARRVLEGMEGEVSPEIIDDARLLVSELVTNSVLHGRVREEEEIELKVTTDGPGSLRVEVSDPGHGGEPSPRTESTPLASEWGLYLVEKLSDRWGVVRDGETRVWFEISSNPPTR